MRKGSVVRADLRHGLPVSNNGRYVMLTKTILTATAIALAATIGSASAGEQFTTLEGVTAVAMSSSELHGVTGSARHFEIFANGRFVNPNANERAGPWSGDFFLVDFTHSTNPVAKGYNGLCVALGNGTIMTVEPCS